MQTQGVKLFLVAFVTILVGIVFVQVIANTVTSTTTSATYINESVAAYYVYNQSALSYDNLLTDTVYVWNSTDDVVPASNWDVDYANGLINFTVNGTYAVTYGYYPDTYVSSSPTRAFINLLPLLFAIAVVLSAGYYFLRKTDFF